MGTKFILHGGGAQKKNAENDAFFKEILMNTANNVKVLLVHFASGKEKSGVNKEKDEAQFERNKGNKNISFEIADEDKFALQVKEADVIYFGGGTTPNLMKALQKFNNLKKIFEGKVVAGESAGANSLSRYCYSQSGGGVLSGMGLVAVKTICHYVGEHKEVLEAIDDDGEVLLLSNYQYRVF